MRRLVFVLLLGYLVTWVESVAPTLNEAEIKVSLDENDVSTNGNTLHDFNTECSGASGTYTFTYTYDPPNGTYVLDALANGKVKMKSDAAPDYEAAPQYSVWVRCVDSGSGDVSGEEAALTLQLNDINEEPISYCVNKTIYINEIASPDTLIVGDNGVAVTEPDGNDQLTWTLLTSTGKDFYYFNKISGTPETVEIRTSKAIDYEDDAINTAPCKALLIKAEDTASNAVTCTVTICAQDDNDNAPKFAQDTYTASFHGIGTAVGTTLTTVLATDDDASAPSNTITYSVSTSSPAYPYVKFDGNTLKVDNHIDVHFGGKFDVTILAIDGGGTTPANTATAVVTVYQQTTTTSTTPSTTTPSGYNFWDQTDNLIAMIFLMLFVGLIAGGLCLALWHYCKYGYCMPESCRSDSEVPDKQESLDQNRL